MKSKGLGRGLGELLSSGIEDVTPNDRLIMLPIQDIRPGRYQPRTQMDEGALKELAQSISAQGVIQPIIVRELALSEYEIIAGERRWRASQMAGLTEIPAVIKSITDENALAIGLIENIQRQNLNPIEEALGLKRLAEEFGLTHEAIAQAVGRSRSSISNSLRLLNLSAPVKDLVYQGRLEAGHVRALLTLAPAEQAILAQKAAHQGWSVREIERQSQQILHQGTLKPVSEQSGEAEYLANKLAQYFQAKVEVRLNPDKSGFMRIGFDDNTALHAILSKLNGDWEEE